MTITIRRALRLRPQRAGEADRGRDCVVVTITRHAARDVLRASAGERLASSSPSTNCREVGEDREAVRAGVDQKVDTALLAGEVEAAVLVEDRRTTGTRPGTGAEGGLDAVMAGVSATGRVVTIGRPGLRHSRASASRFAPQAHDEDSAIAVSTRPVAPEVARPRRYRLPYRPCSAAHSPQE